MIFYRSIFIFVMVSLTSCTAFSLDLDAKDGVREVEVKAEGKNERPH
jgi:hypothetical protein